MSLDRKKVAAADAFLAVLDRRMAAPTLAERVWRTLDSAAVGVSRFCSCGCEEDDSWEVLGVFYNCASPLDADVFNNPVDGIEARPRMGFSDNIVPDGIKYVTLKDLGIDLEERDLTAESGP